jgi:sec-independent protein translocase protein TatC
MNWKKKKRPAEEAKAAGAVQDAEALAEGEEEALAEGGQGTLMSHLLALRQVVFISAIAVVVAFFVVFYLAIDPLMN